MNDAYYDVYIVWSHPEKRGVTLKLNGVLN